MGKKGSNKNAKTKESNKKSTKPPSKVTESMVDTASDSNEAGLDSTPIDKSDVDTTSSNEESTEKITSDITEPSILNTTDIVEPASESISVDETAEKIVIDTGTIDAIPVIGKKTETITPNETGTKTVPIINETMVPSSSYIVETSTESITNSIEPAIVASSFSKMVDKQADATQTIEISATAGETSEKSTSVVDVLKKDTTPDFIDPIEKIDSVDTEALTDTTFNATEPIPKNTPVTENSTKEAPLSINEPIENPSVAGESIKETTHVEDSVDTISADVTTENIISSVDSMIKEAVAIVDDVIEEAISIVDDITETKPAIDETSAETTSADEKTKSIDPAVDETLSQDSLVVSTKGDENIPVTNEMLEKASSVVEKIDESVPAVDEIPEKTPLSIDKVNLDITEIIEQNTATVGSPKATISVTDEVTDNPTSIINEATLKSTLVDENLEESFTFIDKKMVENFHTSDETTEETIADINEPVEKVDSVVVENIVKAISVDNKNSVRDLSTSSEILENNSIIATPGLKNIPDICGKPEENLSAVDETADSTIHVNNENIELTSTNADEKLSDPTPIKDEKLENLSVNDKIVEEAIPAVNKILEKTDPIIEDAALIVDEKLDDVARIVGDKNESIDPIVDNKSEGFAPIVDDKAESVASIVDDKAEDVASIVGGKIEDVASIFDGKTENALIIDEKIDNAAPIVDEKIDVASAIDEKNEEVAPIVDKENEDPAPILDEKIEEAAPIVDEKNEVDFMGNKNVEENLPGVSESLEEIPPIVNEVTSNTSEKIEESASMIDETNPFVNEAETKTIPVTENVVNEVTPAATEPVVGNSHVAAEPVIESTHVATESIIENVPIATEPIKENSRVTTESILESTSPLIESVVNNTFVTEPVADNNPATEHVVDNTPVTEPVVDDTTVIEPVIDNNHFTEPVVDNTPVTEPVADNNPVTEPVADNNPVTEPVVDNSPVTEPVVDNTPITKPVVNTPVTEPVVDDSTVFEPEIEVTPVLAESTEEIAQFCAFSSSINLVFWPHVTKLKLEVIKLNSDQFIPISGTYSCLSRKPKSSNQAESLDHILPFLMIDEQSFAYTEHQYEDETDINDTLQSIIQCKLPGQLRIVDHKEELIKLRKEFTHQVGNKMIDEMANDIVLLQPGLFGQFFLSCYLDIKKYVHSYHFFFPAFRPTDPQHNVISPHDIPNSQPRSYVLSDVFSTVEVGNLKDKLATFLKLLKKTDLTKFGGFFLCKKITKQDTTQFEIDFLSKWDDFYSDTESSDIFVGFADPSSKADNLGWPLRNFLYFAARFKQLKNVKLIRIHFTAGMLDLSASYFTEVSLGHCPSDEIPVPSGWETGTGKKISPRTIDVSQMLNPEVQAASAVQLNLQLMRWRAEPNADLGIISNSKCLVLGAGTLGTYVARSLMAWGVNSITFVDNGKVSFSNPVRQPLYEYQDCLSGGKYKAEAATQALLRIHPKINATGYKLTIPMPGHALTAPERTKTIKEVKQLDQLIKDHDVIFLLTDSRESRWLPTLLASYHNKLLLNAALGFDMFMVMRHGLRNNNDWKECPKLGCYFCTDVVAPTDSLSDRTLDEQCTVTRPGIAALASSLAVEMMVSVLQHPLKGLANPPDQKEEKDQALELNRLAQVIPHQIRYFLSKFNSLNLVGQSYPQCTACSEKVLEAYHTEGFEFLEKVFGDPHYLTKVTGLDDLLENMEDINVSESDSDLDDFELISHQPNDEKISLGLKLEDSSINLESTDVSKENDLQSNVVPKNIDSKLFNPPQISVIELTEASKDINLELTEVPREVNLDLTEPAKEDNSESTKDVNLESMEALKEIKLKSSGLSKEDRSINIDSFDASKSTESETNQDNLESSKHNVSVESPSNLSNSKHIWRLEDIPDYAKLVESDDDF